MSNEEMIFKVVEKALEDLESAQRAADNTPRPVNACPAHDSQFALTKAISGALGTLLMMAQQALKDGVPQGWMGILYTKWPWIFGCFAVFSPNFNSIADLIKGFFK